MRTATALILKYYRNKEVISLRRQKARKKQKKTAQSQETKHDKSSRS